MENPRSNVDTKQITHASMAPMKAKNAGMTTVMAFQHKTGEKILRKTNARLVKRCSTLKHNYSLTEKKNIQKQCLSANLSEKVKNVSMVTNAVLDIRN